jgi:hypothetical protein
VLSKVFYRIKSIKNNFLFFSVFFFISIVSVYGQEADVKQEIKSNSKKIGVFDLENGFERYFFYTRYQIGGKIISRQGAGMTYFPLSELKFPLDVFMIYAKLNLTFLDRITIHYSVRKNLHNRVGKMKDSDWVPFPNVKTIYSESDARLNAIITEADLIVRLFTVSIFSVKLGAGFMHQYLYYSCSNVVQRSIIDNNLNFAVPQIFAIQGKIITYEVQYYLFTLQIPLVFNIPIGKGFLQIIPTIRFSPYVRAKDIDDHILRGKIAKGDSKGMAFMPFLTIRYIFSTKIFITAKLEYMILNTKGKQTQSYYNPFLEPSVTNYIPGKSAQIDNKLKSEQLSVSLGAGYSFEF